MKQILALLLLLPTLSQAADCVDLSGDFFVNGRRLPEQRYVMTIRQTGCDLIAVGGYTLANGTQRDVKSPQPMYVNEAKRELCRACVGFKVAKNAFEIQTNSQVEVGKSICAFSKVKMDLRGRDFRQTYTLRGESAACRKVGSTHAVVQDRLR
ncbi:MAG: hypothetical protein AB7K68_12240 [Bacteriovoracia bacterium]